MCAINAYRFASEPRLRVALRCSDCVSNARIATKRQRRSTRQSSNQGALSLNERVGDGGLGQHVGNLKEA
jgi:hypothetical protein